MHPAFLDDMSWEMAEVYGAITDQIMINLARHFPFYQAGIDNLPHSAFQYQAAMLAQMGQVNQETVRIIRNGLADADEALKGALEQSIIDAVRTSEPDLLDAVKKGIFQPATPPAVSPNQFRAFQLYYTQSADKLNLVNTVMLESTQSAYAQMVSDVVSDIELADRMAATYTALDVAAGETITGVSSWNQALKHATDRLKDRGITGFVDHAGHQWSAEAYVAMDIRTTVFNTGRAAVWETNQNFGNDLYIVSYHNGARPLCYPWQNKVISSIDAARTVIDLDGNEIEVIAQSATSYGQAAGLFGINCKHYPTPFIPGVSVVEGKPQNEADNARTYEQSQQQRALERKIREEKRDILMAQAQGAPQEEIDKLTDKARQTSRDIDEFCRNTGRARHRDREAVYTKREFPDKEKYDVSAFERTQKEAIDQYFSGGGAKSGYQFDQMTQKDSAVSGMPKAQTLQMFDEALEWAEEAYNAEIDSLREGWANVPSQIDAIDEFERSIPKYERILADAVDREDFAIRTSSGDIAHILEDGKFKSQIETGSSHGYLDIDRRKLATQQLFAGSEPIQVADDQYEIYGYLGNAPRAKMYGESRIVLKKRNLLDRTTLTVGDSLELLETGADPMATLATDPKIVSYGKVFSDSIPNAPQRLEDAKRDFDSIAKSGYLSDGNYVELQFHGTVTTEDIEYIEISRKDKNARRIEELSKNRGVIVKWK